jgi:hypothetical protein
LKRCPSGNRTKIRLWHEPKFPTHPYQLPKSGSMSVSLLTTTGCVFENDAAKLTSTRQPIGIDF